MMASSCRYAASILWVFSPEDTNVLANTLYKVTIDAHNGDVDGVPFLASNTEFSVDIHFSAAAVTTQVDDELKIGKPFTDLSVISAASNINSENLLYIRVTAPTAVTDSATAPA
jgi:hypothetical protein